MSRSAIKNATLGGLLPCVDKSNTTYFVPLANIDFVTVPEGEDFMAMKLSGRTGFMVTLKSGREFMVIYDVVRHYYQLESKDDTDSDIFATILHDINNVANGW